MGGHSTTQTSTQSTENVQESNLQDTGGTTVAGNTGGSTTVNNVQTDDGAVAAALASNYSVTKAALSVNGDVSQAAIDLGSKAISSGQAVANQGLDNAAAAYQSGLTFGTDALDAVESLASENAQQQTNLVNNALGGFSSLATQNSASTDTQLQKVALYAIVAAVVLVFLVSRK